MKRRKTRRVTRRKRRIADRFEVALVSLVLIGVGTLIGSFWIEWRGTRLDGAPAADTAPASLDARLKVEVLNGSGDKGAAALVRDHLRARGFDVVSAENADHFDYTITYVLNRSGHPGAARQVASQLGVDSVANAIDPDLFLDATVILGADWRERFPPE
jgi:hypothetical protein